MLNKDKINYRAKGKSSDGRIARGFIHDAHSKLSSGSIPSKFETIIYKNNNVKAFGSSSGRFFAQQGLEEKPAPGQYTNTNTTFSTVDTSMSVSKKGYGNGFASTSQRNTFQLKYLNSGPGPGYYEGKKNNQILEQRTQNLQGSSAFLSRGKGMNQTQSLSKVRIETPGPAEYKNNPDYGKAITSYNSAFISQTKRAQYLNLKPGPGAGQYNIKRNVIQKKPYVHQGVSSSFQPPVIMENKMSDLKQLTRFLDDKKIDLQGRVYEENKNNKPGPGEYSPNQPNFESEHQKQQNSSNFKGGVKNRFGDYYNPDKEPLKQPVPGPDSYKVEDVKGFNSTVKEKAQVCGSYFQSETMRQPYGKFYSRLGPNLEIPYLPNKKKTFHLNLAREWI